MDIVEVVGGTFVLAGSVVVLLASIVMVRARDAVTRINSLSPVTAFGLPLIVLGEFATTVQDDGVTAWGLVRLGITLVALLVVSSVASNTLARAAVLSGARIDPRTNPNHLARDGRTA